MITNDVKTSNTLATEILLALDELQAQVEAKGLRALVAKSRFVNSSLATAVCLRDGSLYSVESDQYAEFDESDGIVIAGITKRKHITLPDLDTTRKVDSKLSLRPYASSGAEYWPTKTLWQWRRLSPLADFQQALARSLRWT